MLDYNKRLTEVDEILNYLSKEEFNKIPEDIKQFIKENKDNEYIWNYDESKSLKEQNLSRDTIAILSYLNMEYLLNDEQKQLMEIIHELNEKEKLKEEYSSDNQYNYDDLFKNNKKEQNKEENKEIVVVKKQSLFTRIINKLKEIFK